MKLIIDNTKKKNAQNWHEKRSVIYAIDYLTDELLEHQSRLMSHDDAAKLEQLHTLLDYFRLKEIVLNQFNR